MSEAKNSTRTRKTEEGEMNDDLVTNQNADGGNPLNCSSSSPPEKTQRLQPQLAELRHRYPRGLFCNVCDRLILEWVGLSQERPYTCADCRQRLGVALKRRVTSSEWVHTGAPPNRSEELLSDEHLSGTLRDTEKDPHKPRAKYRKGGRPTSDSPSRHSRYRRRTTTKMSAAALSDYRAREVARVQAYRARRT